MALLSTTTAQRITQDSVKKQQALIQKRRKAAQVRAQQQAALRKKAQLRLEKAAAADLFYQKSVNASWVPGNRPGDGGSSVILAAPKSAKDVQAPPLPEPVAKKTAISEPPARKKTALGPAPVALDPAAAAAQMQVKGQKNETPWAIYGGVTVGLWALKKVFFG
jgi:hypothetical protein